jgi:hypothetical protein
MKFKLLVLVLFISKIGYSQSKQLDDYKISNINNVIRFFKQKNIDKISSIIAFPLHREYPIPSIKNEKEFKQRFNEIFDKTLIDKIASSTNKQWLEVGWRGIMLDHGDVWINSDGEKIIAVNYQTDFEKKLKKDLIDNEKENLYISLKNFERPIYKIKTKKYLIRIDELSNDKYRYASWKIGKKESSNPDIILNNGILEFQGSGGYHIITFLNGHYTYKVYIDIIGIHNTPNITLEVGKDGKTMLTENGTLVTE